jgi:hypothetical protein
VSQPSPPTGAATKSRSRGVAPSSGAPGARAIGEKLEVGLEHARWRHFGWALSGLIPGGFLIWKLGAVGQGIGALFVLAGLWATWHFARTLMFPAGTIVIDSRRVSLPRGLCRGGAIELAIDDVRHAYFLRRAVPWTRAAPVLVIETENDAHMFPRDWFVTEADQRRIVSRLVDALRHRPAGGPAGGVASLAGAAATGDAAARV